MTKRAPATISLTSLIALITISTVVLLLSSLLFVVKHESKTAAISSAESLFSGISSKIVAQVDGFLSTVTTLTDTGALVFKAVQLPVPEDILRQDTPAMQAMLKDRPQFMSVYVGYDDGAFHQLIATRGTPFILEKYDAPAGTAYIDRTIVDTRDSGRQQQWRYLDANLNEISSKVDPEVKYDPRQRPWFKKALHSNQSVFTAPYVFSSSKLPGLTCASVLESAGGVFGVDVTLA